MHIQALYPADGILTGSSSKHRILVINLASVPADSWPIPQLPQSPGRYTQAKEETHSFFFNFLARQHSFLKSFSARNVSLYCSIVLAAFVLSFGSRLDTDLQNILEDFLIFHQWFNVSF
jgi:hypothetical protein